MIFIPFNVPSLKNSKVKTAKGVFFSKTVRKYLQKLGVKNYHVSLSKKKIEAGLVKVENYKTRPNLFIKSVGDYFENVEYPARLRFYFVRDSKRKFDFHNAVQIIADLLVSHDFIIDDDMDHFLPYPWTSNGIEYHVDKDRPGVFIQIIGKGYEFLA